MALARDGFAARLTLGTPPLFESWPAPAWHGDYAVVFCGFIANRSSLTEALGLFADRATTDGQIFAAACARWGSDLPHHVLGEYCVVVFDRRGDKLLATHDALAVRPLFHTQDERGFICASHLGALMRRIGPRALDESWVHDYIAFGIPTRSQTVYRGVRALGIGRSLTLKVRAITPLLSETDSWCFGTRKQTVKAGSRELEERFRFLLAEGIATATEGRTWAELSGGLDSSSVVCAAVQHGHLDLELVSIVYPLSKTADEREFMEELLRQHRLPWHTLDADAAPAFSMMPDRNLASPTPTALNWRLFRQYELLMQQRGVRTVLTGVGGDNVLFGPPARPVHIADRLRTGRLSGITGELRAWQQADPAPRSLLHMFIEHGLKPLFRHTMRRSLVVEKTEIDACSWLGEALRTGQNLDLRRPPGAQRRFRSVYEQFFYEQVWMTSIDAHLSWNQLGTCFEHRAPILYRPLVEFMFSLPSAEQVRPGQDRILQRRALRGILPEQIRTRRTKRTSDEAILLGLRRSPEAYALLTERPHIVERGYVDPKAWKEAVSMARFGHVRGMRGFLAAASLEFWLRQSKRD
jgi:asparagine synthase (glutamine-hydrolysing)